MVAATDLLLPVFELCQTFTEVVLYGCGARDS